MFMTMIIYFSLFFSFQKLFYPIFIRKYPEITTHAVLIKVVSITKLAQNSCNLILISVEYVSANEPSYYATVALLEVYCARQ